MRDIKNYINLSEHLCKEKGQGWKKRKKGKDANTLLTPFVFAPQMKKVHIFI